MAWVKLDDQAPRHDKMLKAGPSACWLWVCAIAHGQAQLTDGLVTLDSLPMIGIKGVTRARKLAELLVDARLFDRDERGYRVHDYLDHNPSRAVVLAKRAEDAERKRFAESNRTPRGIPPDSRGPRAGVPSHPIPSHPLPSEANTGFERFWAVYPKHTGRKACEAFWARLAADEAYTQAIIAGASAYARHVADWKPQFIKAPIRWLEGAHWTDELGGSATKAETACRHEPACPDRWAHHRLVEAEATGNLELVAAVQRLNAKKAGAA